ncbi:iron-containing alcohol dehydrogenase [Burkholderiaceae bacterium FT117]|uniref:iron-containing alcohol dehydrogenase n=1 Tax=Zeimonas sediminis TaxID=2944268 RepID=UPI002342E097|nr:iron-containing alcohol dehydrogenase [Zeimonas sediminis]MCM5570523.1 iron-containing alcohol dehydrogenase [Zeimonas sediminis]
MYATVEPDERAFFCMPSRVVFGAGSIRKLSGLCARQGWRKALIVTDTFFTGRTRIVSDLVADLAAAGIGARVFDGGEPDPSVELCDAATRSLLAGNTDAGFDHVIAIGGGSNIDLGKGLSLTLKFDKPAESFVGSPVFPGKPLPLVAVPTTSGTGSEITAGAILAYRGSATKVAIMSNDLRPAIALIDPELTLSCPPKVTADAGIDALAHAIESYIALDARDYDTAGDPDPAYSGANRITRSFAHEAIRLCFGSLRRCIEAPDDLAARTAMSYASLFAAMSYASAGLHGVHGTAYALAGLTHASHGSTNGVLLPYVMDALAGTTTAALAEIARLAGGGRGTDAQAAREAAVLTRELVAAVGIPTDLRGFGVTEEQVPGLLRDALAVTRLARAFPIQPPDEAYARIFANAWAGRLGEN